MNPKTTLIHSVRQALVALVSIGLVLGPLADAARAQTALADIPIASKVTAKPNIVYTLDDSGSMQFNYLPDWVIAGAATTNVTKITRVGATATVQVASTAALVVGQWVIITGANQPEYNGEFQIVTIPNGTTFTITIVGTPISPATGTITYAVSTAYCRGGSSTAACSVGALNTFTSPPFYAASFNHLAYDPNVNYQPPVNYDGTPLKHTVGSDTDAAGNQAFFANVQSDPFTSPNTHVNLTAAVTVPLYCNTDWPISLAGAASPLTIADVGDANGEYKAGTGAYCRINGTEYDASIASGAPAVKYANGNLLYDYPYRSSSGATGAQYFYQAITVKTLYCDKTSPYWPKVQGAIIGCTAGGTPTCGGLPCGTTTTQQTCNLNTPAKTCNPTVALRNYTPSACKTPSALYCLPSTGGSDSFSPGTGTVPECLSCTCNADYQPASTKKCSSSGAACTTVCGVPGCDLAECPNIVTPQVPNGCSAGSPIYSWSPAGSTTCSAKIWDPVANLPSATQTTLMDSNAQGYVCRHNNQVYAVSGAPAAGGLFTYPRTNLGDVYAANKTGVAPYTQTGAFTTATTSGCPAVGPISIPRHYYTIDSIAFCDNVDTTVNGPWRGFGTGACTTSSGLPHQNDLTRFQNVKYGQFHRIPLRAGWNGGSYDYVDQMTGLKSTRSFAGETANYGNWFAYYRLRVLAAKTTSSLAFNLLDDTYRVGFHTLGEEPPPIGPTPTTQPPAWVDVADFTPGIGGQKKLWWNALFAVPTVTKVKTPSLSALLRVGNLFETGGAGGLPASVYSLPAGAKDPLMDSSGNIVSCQSNYHIEMTDGFTNQIALPVFAKEQDDVTPAAWPAAGLLPDGSANPDNTMPDLPASSPWPAPFHWGTKAVQDTLADISMYYWARDLRPGVKDDVPSWSGKTPNDIDPTKDVAWWQHVQFSAISFGSAGTLDVENQGATLTAMQPPPTVQWPDVTSPNNPPLPIGNKGAVAIDDLWHATVNARGQYVFATSPLEVQYGLGAILAGISNQRKSRAGAAFSGQVLSKTNDIIYEPTIEQGWAGDLLKVQIDANPKSPTAGQELGTLWRASPVLWDRTLNTGTIAPKFLGDEPWMDESKRRIVTWFGNKKVAFRATATGGLPALDPATQLATLSGDPTGFMQRRMVAYLRGGTTYTTTAADPAPVGTVMTIEGTNIGQFRKRSGPLGDISNAQPLVVTAPYDPPIFNTGADPGYAGFVASQKGYVDRIVAAANDGMVHVFDSSDGHEVFAYVPSSLFRKSVDASGRPTGIQALTFQDGGVPLYRHHFYVDSSPRTADVDCDDKGVCGGGANWRTIVVGGMGKGGNAYYALDLTNGDATDETQAAAKLLWEFSDSDWTYTYGRPIIVKTYQYGWTVIVTSGYNNASGEGRIYLLNPTTGQPQNSLQPFIATPKVTCTAPDGSTETSGLAQINGFTKDFHNQYVEQVYGGDLCGNVWRFDLTAAAGNYPAPQLFAVLTDPGGKRQPVTTAPQIEIDLANGVDRYVFIGTGRLLDVSDLSTPATPQPQTMYAIRDDKLDTPIPDGDPKLPIDPRATLVAVPAGGLAIPGGAPDGWYHDLPDGTGGTIAERVVVDVEGDVNTIAYIGTQVTNDPCTIALPANIYAREYATGTSLINDPLNGWFTHDNAGGVGMQIVGYQDPKTGEITLAGLLSHEIPGTKPIAFKNPSTFGRNRMSWRLMTGE